MVNMGKNVGNKHASFSLRFLITGLLVSLNEHHYWREVSSEQGFMQINSIAPFQGGELVELCVLCFGTNIDRKEVMNATPATEFTSFLDRTEP